MTNSRQKLQRLAASPIATLKLFAAGSVLFFIGLGSLVYIDHRGGDDLAGEVVALLALALLGVGFTLALFAQVLFIWQRLRGNHS